MFSYLIASCLVLSGIFNTVSERLFEQEIPDSTRVEVLLEKSKEALSVDLDLSDSLAARAFELASKEGNARNKCESAIVLASVARGRDAYRLNQWSDTAFYYAAVLKDTFLLGTTRHLQSLAASKSGKFEKALSFSFEARNMFEHVRDTMNIISVLQGISLLYHNHIKDYDLGLKYGFEALRYSERVDEPRQLWRTLNAIAINYDDMGNADKALEFHYRNLKTSVDSMLIATSHNNIGNTLFKSGRYPVALKHFYTALRLHKLYDRPVSLNYNLSTVFNNLSCIYAYMHNPPLSRVYRDSAVYFAHASQEPEKLLDAYRDGYLNSEINNDKDETVFFLKKYLALKDSLYSSEKAKIIYDFEFQYQSQRKESEIALLKSNTEIQKLEVQQSRNYIIMIVTLFVLVTMIAVFLYRRKIQATEIQRVQEREEFQRKQFSAVIEGEEKERSRVAKDLHDGIGQLLSVAKLSLTGLDAADQRNPLVQNAIQTIDEATVEVRNVSHNLMPGVLSTLGLVAGLRDFADKLNRSGKINVRLDVEGFETRLNESVEIHVYRILQEITTNIVKHAGAANITISLAQRNEEINITVVNNGLPLRQEAIDKSTGIGWSNILSRIAILNGKMQITSAVASETRLQIQLAP